MYGPWKCHNNFSCLKLNLYVADREVFLKFGSFQAFVPANLYFLRTHIKCLEKPNANLE